MAGRRRSKGRAEGPTLFILVITFVVAAVVIRAGCDFRHTARGIDTMDDDAYYYTVVARNLATTGEMTFDGISKTNGYHPLWFWLQVAMFRAGAAELSIVDQALAVMLLQWCILGIAFSLVLRWIYRHWIDFPIVAAATLLGVVLLAYPKHLSPFAMGMESALVLPLLPLLLLLAHRSRWIWAGLVALLLVMSRLDTLVYMVFPITLYAAFKGRLSIGSVVRRGLAVGGPALGGVLILMTLYRLGFGHPMPIHGVLRSTFPSVNFQPHLFVQPLVFAREMGRAGRLAMFHLPTALVVLPVCGLVLLRSGALRRPERNASLLLVLLGLIQLGGFLLFQEWAKPVSGWYLGPLMICSSGAVGASVVHILGKRRTVFSCFVLALVVTGLSIMREQRRWHVPVPESSVHAFVRSRPPDAVWAATDCGNIAFRTGATFVNLDGLINGFEYQAALKERDLSGYLERSGVDYLIVNTWETEPAIGKIEPMYAHKLDPALYRGEYETYGFFVYSYMYHAYSDTIRLSRDQEVWRSGPESAGVVSARAVVFDLTE
jgi:hypothetical protein